MIWKDRRVFITGHTGFKGGWLALWLQQRGAVVRGYALNPPSSPSLYDAAGVGRNMESIIGDVRDAAHLLQEFTSFRPEIVFHMAAQSLVRFSYMQPLETYSINVMGTGHLLEAVRACSGVRAVIVVTTDKCYENREWPWPYRETDQLGGHDPYSSSKAAAELVTASYRNSFFSSERHTTHGVALASVRAGNVIGGGDWAANRLIPDLIRSFEEGAPVRIRNPNATRPWQYVLEPLRGYLALAEALYDTGPAFAEAWNFGPRDFYPLSVSALVDRVVRLWSHYGGKSVEWVIDEVSQLHEANLLRLDCSKAASRLHWFPALNIDDALQYTVSWYAAFDRAQDMRDFTFDQIAQYEELVAGQTAHLKASDRSPEHFPLTLETRR